MLDSPKLNDATPTEIINLLRRHRFDVTQEKICQEQIEAILAKSGIAFSREHRLSAADIPDFYFESTGVVLEVKVRGAKKLDIYRQLQRYASYPTVQEIILLTSVAMGLPAEIEGKSTYYVSLGASWL